MSASIKEPFFVLWVSGNEVSEEVLRKIVSLSLTDREKKATDGSIVFSDPDFMLTDSQIFKKGRRIAFIMGWREEMVPRGPFVVKGYNLTAGSDGSPMLDVKFQDLSFKMNKKKKKRKHTGKPAQIIKSIAEEHNLGYDIDSVETLEFNDDFPLIQAGMTDAALLQRLADHYGYVWGVNGMTLYFRRPESFLKKGKQFEPEILSYRINGGTLLSFSADVKFVKNGKKLGAKIKDDIQDVVNDLKEGEFGGAVETVRDTLDDTLGSLGGVIGLDKGQSADDEEALPEDAEQSVDKTLLNAEKGIWKHVEGAVKDLWKDDDETTEEVSSTSSPNEAEAKRKHGAQLIETTEVIDAKISPRIASMLYRPGQSLDIVGVGKKFSGEYKIKEVTQSFGSEGFTTSLSAIKRSFFQTPAQAQRAAKATEKADGATDSTDPNKKKITSDTTVEEKTILVAEEGYWEHRKKLVKKIDGVKDE